MRGIKNLQVNDPMIVFRNVKKYAEKKFTKKEYKKINWKNYTGMRLKIGLRINKI